jgi:hypothetical protein
MAVKSLYQFFYYHSKYLNSVKCQEISMGPSIRTIQCRNCVPELDADCRQQQSISYPIRNSLELNLKLTPSSGHLKSTCLCGSLTLQQPEAKKGYFTLGPSVEQMKDSSNLIGQEQKFVH